MTRTSPLALALLLPALAACSPSADVQAPPSVRTKDVRAQLSVLAADSMEGRLPGTLGSARAARYLAEQLRRFGVEPAGDSAYFQRVTMSVSQGDGEPVYRALEAAEVDTVPPARRVSDVNVVGILRGSDPALREEAVVVGAHFDHIGVGKPVAGDSINNGADDDASGTVAVLEVARALARGPRPRRTVVFLLTTAEEYGYAGIRWYTRHPVVPLARTVADVQVEMIGRPDSLAGGRGKAWLSGYDRSTMGELLTAAGVPVVPDPRAEMGFFERSDNIVFAREGVPAHSISSYANHTDYHQPGDEVEKIDFDHLTRVIDATVRAVRVLADGPAPQWKPGKRPSRTEDSD